MYYRSEQSSLLLRCADLPSEIQDNTWVLPLCAGKRFGLMVGAKLLVFGVLMVLVPIIALLVDYGYSGLLFGFEIGVIPILYGGLLQGIYVLFLLSCLMTWCYNKKADSRRVFDAGNGVWNTLHFFLTQYPEMDTFRIIG